MKFVWIIFYFCSVLADPSSDEVTSLPGLNFNPNFKHYSGYLKAADTRQYHYWFTKAQYETSTTPILLWLSGGPGCSSLAGLLEELGPFHIEDYGNTVYENPYAWNKVGHVFFLESPAGVGFSYATDGNLTTNDDQVATDNYNALIDFFTRKFPELRDNTFYITGESYGGVYVPTLAVLVASDTINFPNFKGIAIGNGLYHEVLNTNTKIPLYFYHGIVRQNLYDKIASQCCNNTMYTCDFYTLWMAKGTECSQLINQTLQQATDLDPYNLYKVCYLDGGPSSKRAYINKFINRKIFSEDAVQGSGLPLCAQVGNNSVIYLNRPEVREALHIPTNITDWQNCNEDFWNFYTIQYFNMSNHFLNLISKKIRILTYNGDVDTVCNVIMNEKFVNQLNLTIQSDDVFERHAWYYNESMYASANGLCCNYLSNIAGYYTKYIEGLDFVTIRGSGHFANEDKPREAQQMIYNYIFQQNYSTPVPFSTVPQPIIIGQNNTGNGEKSFYYTNILSIFSILSIVYIK